ncbi:MAG: glycerate kinase type-2 family protein [Terracidiphilus sp.]
MTLAGKTDNGGQAMRATAREIFAHALAESRIESGFSRNLDCERGILRAGGERYDLAAFSRLLVVSFGKGAHTSLEALQARLDVPVQLAGIVSAPTPPAAPVAGFDYFTGGHPMPNPDSLRAAAAILRALESLDERALVLYLISGGGSAIVERPIAAGITLDDLIETYRALVHSGAPIAEINTVRKHLSAVKGGRMARAAAPARQLSILISDVPDNSLDALASGPTMPDSSTIDQCYELARQYDLLPQLPASVRALFAGRQIEETPKSGDSFFTRSHWQTVLSNLSAREAARQRAVAAGFAVEVDNTCDDWDYRRAADYLLGRVRALRREDPRICLISGGEVTVTVNTRPGTGGRNQQFALYCAERIRDENLCVFSAGTDGIDGNSPAAGAVADGTTSARAREKGLSAAAALESFDAYPLFSALGDAIVTGPTGTNVRDLRLLFAW